MKISYKQTVAIIYTMVLFLDRLDLTVVNVTFPTLARYFGISLIATQWISLAFLLALAISIPISAWLGERFGFKKIYIMAMLIFGISSTFCSLASNLPQLIVLRFLQGLGGGLLIPVGMSMIYRVYDKSEYASITSFTFIPSLIAPAIAPFIGGLLLDALGWRWVFVFSGPLCIMLSIAAMIFLKEQEHHTAQPLDWQGFLLSTLMLTSLLYGLSELSSIGFRLPACLPLLMVIFLLACFVFVERRSPYPLVNLDFFKHALFVRANLIQLCFQICHFGGIFLIGLYLQAGIKFSATLAGLMMGMQAIGAILVSRYSVKLFKAYGAKLPIMIGLSGVGLLSPLILFINTPNLLLAGLLLFLVRGLFSGLCGAPIQTLSVIGFDKTEIPSSSAIFNASRQVSISLGVTISSLLMSFGLHLSNLKGTIIPDDKVLQVFAFGFLVMPCIALVGVIVARKIR